MGSYEHLEFHWLAIPECTYSGSIIIGNRPLLYRGQILVTKREVFLWKLGDRTLLCPSSKRRPKESVKTTRYALLIAPPHISAQWR